MKEIPRGAIYNGLAAMIDDMTRHAGEYIKATGLRNEELEYQIVKLLLAKKIVNDWVDPCDIPF